MDNIVYRCEWFDVSEWQMEEFERMFPGVPIECELLKMTGWLRVNPNRRKKNYPKFIYGWLAKAHRELLCAEMKGNAIASYKDRQVRKEARAGLLHRMNNIS